MTGDVRIEPGGSNTTHHPDGAVTDYVHAWLFPPKAKSAAGKVKRAKAGVAAARKTGN